MCDLLVKFLSAVGTNGLQAESHRLGMKVV